jgi:hypothetical protein
VVFKIKTYHEINLSWVLGLPLRPLINLVDFFKVKLWKKSMYWRYFPLIVFLNSEKGLQIEKAGHLPESGQ